MSTPRPYFETRIVTHDMGQVRRPDRNEGTLFGAGTDPHLVRAEVPFEALFFAHYEAIRELARVASPGAAIVAVHAPSGALAGRVWLARHADRPNAAIVGRHSECDLILNRGGISLRHLALIVPKGPDGSARFWLRELRARGGLDSEQGQPIGGAFVEGAALFRVGGYALFAFATGTPDRWPERATEAWQAFRGRSAPLRIVRPGDRARTPPGRLGEGSVVSVIRGPLQTDEALVEPGATRTCTLRLDAGARRVGLALGEAALGRGVLFGRYARCDSATLLADDNISRVHLLVVRVEDDIVAIDTASTNGVYLDAQDERPTRVVLLSRGQVAILGEGLATVRLSD